MPTWTGTLPTFVAGARALASKLQTLADVLEALSGEWTTFNPTPGNVNLGDTGTAVGRYRRIGRGHLDYDVVLTFGGTGISVATPPTITLPATPAAHYGSNLPVGLARYLNSGSGRWEGEAYNLSDDVATLFYATEVGEGSGTNISGSAPFTWAAGDVMAIWGRGIELAAS